jgi:hypothetical protein
MMTSELDWAFGQYAFEDLSRQQWGQIVAEIIRLRLLVDRLERDLNGYDAGEVDKW